MSSFRRSGVWLYNLIMIVVIGSLVTHADSFSWAEELTKTEQQRLSWPNSSDLEASPQDQTSRATMLWAMEHKVARDIWRNIQWEMINLPVDTRFNRIFFSLHGVLADLFQALQVLHNQSLNHFSKVGLTNMAQLVPGYPGRYRRIVKILCDVAQDQGFPAKAIKNLEIYIQRNPLLNAATVSGNHERIIVIINSALIDKMNYLEIRGVLAHELGHIRSFHSVGMVLHKLLMGFILRNYSTSAEKEENHLINLSPTHLMDAKFLDQEVMAATSGNLQSETSPLMIALAKLENLLPEEKDDLIHTYIQAIVNTMTEMEAPPASLAYFNGILNTNFALHRIKLKAKPFTYHADEAMNAISRAREKSADQYALSTVPNEYIASAFGKLLGLDFEPKDRHAIFDLLIKQYEKFQAETPIAERAPYIGQTHPSLVPRLVGILKNPSHPSLIFANPFMRLLLLNDGLSSSGSLDHEAQAFHEELEGKILSSLQDLGILSPVNPRFNNLIQYRATLREILLVGIENLNQVLQQTSASENKKKTLETIEIFKEELAQPSSLISKLKQMLINEAQNGNLTASQQQTLEQRLQLLDIANTGMDRNQMAEIKNLVTPNRKRNPYLEQTDPGFRLATNLAELSNSLRSCRAILLAVGK